MCRTILWRSCVQCSWIFTFTIFGNIREGYPFSTKWLPRDHHVAVLKPEFCILRLRYTLKRQKMERGSSKNAQFSFCGGREAFHQEIVRRGIQTCFLHSEARGLFWNATKAEKFLLNFQVQFAPCGQQNSVFEKEFMYL